MCGRFVVLTNDELASVVAAVQARDATALPQVGQQDGSQMRAQARPGSTVSLLSPDKRGDLQVANAQWGFDVEWSKRPVFNTRIESAIGDAVLWRNAVRDGRCVVPAVAFFEPHENETVASPKTGRAMKRPYQFWDPAGVPLLLAGVQEGGRCSIVTCEPNRWVAPVHSRMPLILRFREVPTWLGPDWPTLADRSLIELAVAPEQLAAPSSSGLGERPVQLSLFPSE